MTTATLARGPPLDVGGSLASLDEDANGLMESIDEEDESVENNSPTLAAQLSSRSRGSNNNNRATNSHSHSRGRISGPPPSRSAPTGHRPAVPPSGGNNLSSSNGHDDESDEETGDPGEEHANNYSNGQVMDFSTSTGGGQGKHGSSDGEGEQDPDQENDDQEDEQANGSIQSYDEYQRNGVPGSGLYSSGGGKNASLDDGTGNGSIGKAGSGGKSGKSFVCDICMKTFSNAANMRRHRVRHSGIKPFECRFCQKRFFRKDHMREHMNHKHNNTQMECYFCQQVFDKEKDLFQHVTRDHDVNPRELHCHYCSFSATTIGRYLWHLTTSHPRKNSHYLDSTNNTDSISMAPYALDNDYESPSTSPTVVVPPSRTTKTSTPSVHPAYELPPKQRDYESYAKRDASASPVSKSTSFGYFDENNALSQALQPTARSRSVRYVSLLPAHLLGGTSPEDLSSYGQESQPEDLSSSYSLSSSPENIKAYGMFKKSNGLSGPSVTGSSRLGPPPTTASPPPVSTGSNRRKNKAPVRMAASPDEAPALNGGGGVKREYPYAEEEPREKIPKAEQPSPFSSMLEEVMSHSSTHNRGTALTLAQSLSRNTQAEDMSGASPVSLTAAAALAQARSVIKTKGGLGGNPNGNGIVSTSSNGNGVGAAAANQAAGVAECEAEHKCPHCLIIYPDNVMYLLHKMLHSKNSNQPYRCAVCFNNYPNRYEFYAHVVNHRQ